MKLTEAERLLIARRAHGEYAIIPNVRKIVEAHRKNRRPEDAVFLDFARLVMRKSWDWDDYERLARAVLEVIPEPYGTPWWKKPRTEPKPAGATPAPKKKKKRVIRCGICSGSGHNSRTCPNKPDTPTVTHTDGIERLSPGFDPNPPKVEEDQEDDS